MAVTTHDVMAIQSSEDVVRVRQVVRQSAVAIGMSLVDQTKIVTAASEIARNTVDHGGGGHVRLEILETGVRRGLRLTFEDKGPGIPNIELAMKEGYSTGGGLGLGLPGARRLSNEFEVVSEVGRGTRVSMVRWK